jgi:hypothetical protein
MAGVKAGRVDPKIGTALACIATPLLKAMEVGELEALASGPKLGPYEIQSPPGAGGRSFSSNAGEPPPPDFLQVRRVTRILSKEALFDYAPDHKQRDKSDCHRQIEHRVTSEDERY